MVLALLFVAAPSFVAVPLTEVKGNVGTVRISDSGYVACSTMDSIYLWQGGKVRWRASQRKFVPYEDDRYFGIRVVANDWTIGGSYGKLCANGIAYGTPSPPATFDTDGHVWLDIESLESANQEI